jgi:hypothetical protein
MRYSLQGLIRDIKVNLIWDNGKVVTNDPVVRRFIEMIFERYDGIEIDSSGSTRDHIKNPNSFLSILSKELTAIHEYVQIL